MVLSRARASPHAHERTDRGHAGHYDWLGCLLDHVFGNGLSRSSRRSDCRSELRVEPSPTTAPQQLDAGVPNAAFSVADATSSEPALSPLVCLIQLRVTWADGVADWFASVLEAVPGGSGC